MSGGMPRHVRRRSRRGSSRPVRVWPDRVVVVPPCGEHEPGVRQRGEQRLVEAFVAQTAVEVHEAVLHRLARRDVVPLDRRSCDQRRMADEVSSMPLSLTTVCGLPRIPIRLVSSRATRAPDSDVSATSARHSREKSSTTHRMEAATTDQAVGCKSVTTAGRTIWQHHWPARARCPFPAATAAHP